jgi:hypothetical protein
MIALIDLLVFALLFSIWKSDNLLNLSLRMLFMVLVLVNAPAAFKYIVSLNLF